MTTTASKEEGHVAQLAGQSLGQLLAKAREIHHRIRRGRTIEKKARRCQLQYARQAGDYLRAAKIAHKRENGFGDWEAWADQNFKDHKGKPVAGCTRRRYQYISRQWQKVMKTVDDLRSITSIGQFMLAAKGRTTTKKRAGAVLTQRKKLEILFRHSIKNLPPEELPILANHWSQIWDYFQSEVAKRYGSSNA